MGLNMDAMKKRKEEMDQNNFDTKFFDLKDGPNAVRVLPRSTKYFTKDKDDDFAFRFYVHYGLFDVQGFKMLVCRKSFGEACPICEYVKAKVLTNNAKERFIYNVLDLETGELKILTTGPQVYQQILDFVLHPEYGDLFDVEGGTNLTIERVPKEKSNTGWVTYKTIPARQPSDITDQLPEKWEEEIDKLLEKGIPHMFSEEEMAEIIAVHEKGGDPTPIGQKGKPQKSEEAKAAQDSPTPQQKKEPPQKPKASVPDCYGDSFKFSDPKCKACAVRQECKKEFFSKEA
jgi:hypothetical protein